MTISQRVEIGVGSQQVFFFGTSALLFLASAAVTIVWCLSMSTMCGMPMPGGWTMSMAWMLMPGQTWFDAAASFLGMWIVMMVAMMLPSLTPMLWRYRESVSRPGIAPNGWLTARVAAGYFAVWAVVGLAAYPLGVALASAATQLPALASAVPMLTGVIVMVAGMVQFTAWKARHLACCRALPVCDGMPPSHPGAAWRHGLHLGLHCNYCCANLTIILLVIGVMDLHVMAIVTAAITLERLAPLGERVARAVGAAIVGTGFFLVVEAAGLA